MLPGGVGPFPLASEKKAKGVVPFGPPTKVAQGTSGDVHGGSSTCIPGSPGGKLSARTIPQRRKTRKHSHSPRACRINTSTHSVCAIFVPQSCRGFSAKFLVSSYMSVIHSEINQRCCKRLLSSPSFFPPSSPVSEGTIHRSVFPR